MDGTMAPMTTTRAADLDESAAGERCAAHPGRIAVDSCPVCGRPRCAPDQLPSGCTLCKARPEDPAAARRRPRPPELLVRGVLAAYATTVAWAYVTAEYVEASWLAYFAPALLGILCGWAALSAARNPRRGLLLQRVRVAAVVCSVLGIGLGFLLENPYSRPPLELDVVLPYPIAAAAAWLWTAPPKPRKRKERG